MFGNPAQLIRSYELYQVIIEMAVIWVCVYAVVRFMRGLRGAGMLKGLVLFFVLLTLLIRVLGQNTDAFGRLNYLYDRFLALVSIVLIVIFQPELRQAMIRLGHSRHFRSKAQLSPVIQAISEAVQFLGKNQFGALIAIERNVKFDDLVERGQAIDAEISAPLLESIFWPNSPLHDLGVVVRGNRIVAAGVQFPLAEEGNFPTQYGSRHRAAAGLTNQSDCIVVIVSEENGAVSIAEGGLIEYDIPRDEFERVLADRFEVSLAPVRRTDDEPEAPVEETPAAAMAAKQDAA